MTSYILAGIQAHPVATGFLLLLIFSFLAVVWLLAYHGSGPQMDQRGHNGPYRPRWEADDSPEALKRRATDAVAEYRAKQRLENIAAGHPLKGRRT